MNPEKKHTKETIVSHMTFYPPFIYLGALVVGLIVDLIVNIRILPEDISIVLGVLFLIIAPLLIFWAHNSTYFLARKNKAHEIENIKVHHFRRGPYKFSRNPIYLGLVFLVLGFSLLINSIFIFFALIIAFIFVHTYILPREEKFLKDTYGEDYLEYREAVRTWL
ncbi:hypothetical protein COB64_01880 [Candidatus Wolfebacteria bacterium]|nr:MAG: hypothetical protein COB64_01880 [Candidatus Wolfebacteria bacterium]